MNANVIILAIACVVMVFYFVMILDFFRYRPKLSDSVEEWVMWLMLMGISCLCIIGGVMLVGRAIKSMGWL